MIIENISIVVAIITLLFTIVSDIILLLKRRKNSFFKSKKEIEHQIMMYHLELKNLTELNRKEPIDDLLAVGHLRYLLDTSRKIYPKANFNLSVKIIHINEENIDKSTAKNWIAISDNKYGIRARDNYIIKENTDFHSIFMGNCKYFLVTDMKEYDSIVEYKNQSPNFKKMYETAIVYPIKKHSIHEKKYLGFLCINSPQKLRNVKKNEILLNIIKSTAKAFSIILSSREDLYEEHY